MAWKASLINQRSHRSVTDFECREPRDPSEKHTAFPREFLFVGRLSGVSDEFSVFIGRRGSI